MKTLPKVFIVGESGTTGLRLQDRLSERKDIELLHLPEDKRKDIQTIQAFAKKQTSCSSAFPTQPRKRW